MEQEIDCDAEDARSDEDAKSDDVPGGEGGASGGASGAGTPGGRRVSDGERERERAVGYDRHEIEGIGGVLKKKLLRMVRVGACVAEGADEQAVLAKEKAGEARSWCGWCCRVVPGDKDDVVKT